MAIPVSVDEAANLAEELHSKMFPQEPVTDDSSNEGEQEQEVVEEVVDDEEVEEELSPAEEKKFRDRYMTLKGKYDAEVPRLAAELRELRELVNKPKPAVVEDALDEDSEDDGISAVSDEYGEDFINAIRRVIQHEVKPIIKPVVDQTQSLQNTQTEAATESFKSYLDNKVDKGNWREVWESGDPKFLEFLKQPDPSELYTYGDLVEMYNENWDGDRLAKVFNTYFEQTQTTPDKGNKRTNQPNPQKDALIAPSRTNTQPSPSNDGARIWTMDAFNQFQKDDRSGKYSPEESQRLWDDVAKAPSEGRMR